MLAAATAEPGGYRAPNGPFFTAGISEFGPARHLPAPAGICGRLMSTSLSPTSIFVAPPPAAAIMLTANPSWSVSEQKLTSFTHGCCANACHPWLVRFGSQVRVDPAVFLPDPAVYVSVCGHGDAKSPASRFAELGGSTLAWQRVTFWRILSGAAV